MKVLILDFDGTIVDSHSIKGRVFRKLYENEGEEFMTRVEDFHEAHTGRTRFEKFREFASWRGETLTPEQEAGLGQAFHALVEAELMRAPYIEGFEDFLARIPAATRLFIVSVADAGEIADILKRRGIQDRFERIYGFVESKADTIRTIMEETGVPSDEVMYVGDAPADEEAAKEAGVPFTGIMSTFFKKHPPSSRCIASFSEFPL